MNTLLDYYQILGVDPSVTAAALRTAYHQKVMQCHPDRGGTHDEMVRVAEAWEVLSDPQLRADYDRARQAVNDAAAQAAWQAQSEAVRTTARQRSRSWTDLHHHVETILNDVSAAEYSRVPFIGGGIPTAKGSVSAVVFIICGGIYGFFSMGYVIHTLFSNEVWQKNGGTMMTCGAISGAWLGRAAHQYWRDKRRAKTSNPTTIVDCPSCGQKLRIPVLNAAIDVHCPKCNGKFSS